MMDGHVVFTSSQTPLPQVLPHAAGPAIVVEHQRQQQQQQLQLHQQQQQQQQQQEEQVRLGGLVPAPAGGVFPQVTSSPLPALVVAVTPPPLREAFPFGLPPASTGAGSSHFGGVDKMAAANPNANANVSGNGGGPMSAADGGDMEVEVEEKREHKKRSKNWTRPETLKLIRLRTELDPRFAKTGRKTELWDEIAESLQRERFSRDAQQCRDKWEKLTAQYKEVRDGLKDREDNPFYDELYPLLSGKHLHQIGRQREHCSSGGGEVVLAAAASTPDGGGALDSSKADDEACAADVLSVEGAAVDMDAAAAEAGAGGGGGGRQQAPTAAAAAAAQARKRRRVQKYIAVTDVAAVQGLLETVVSRQQRLLRELLEAQERREILRERQRQEKEERWRAEERAQRLVFNNAMLALCQHKLVGDAAAAEGLAAAAAAAAAAGGGGGGSGSPEGVGGGVVGGAGVVVGCGGQQGGPKKRSKNWKRTEVLQLIKLRGDMEAKFAKSTRRAALWDEVAELLKAQGIKRDGKQCREKWDKLMAEYKDVADGKREQGESHYFAELTAIVSKPSADPPPLTSP